MRDCPNPNGCAYCAEHGCPRAVPHVETHIDRECRVLGHEFALEPDADEGDPMTCVHCGAEYDDR